MKPMTTTKILAGAILIVMTAAAGLGMETWFSRQRTNGTIPAWIDITLWLGVLLAILVEWLTVVAI